MVRFANVNDANDAIARDGEQGIRSVNVNKLYSSDDSDYCYLVFVSAQYPNLIVNLIH